jgi:hypothetical protein
MPCVENCLGEKNYAGDHQSQWGVLAWMLQSLPFETYDEAECVAQVTVSMHLTHWNPYWWLTCQTEHFRLILWWAWPTWWMPFQDTASFLELLIPLTNAQVRWSIFSIHPPKLPLNSHLRLWFCTPQHTVLFLQQYLAECLCFHAVTTCSREVLPSL